MSAKGTAKQQGELRVMRAALEQMPVMARLLEFYAYDFSEWIDIVPGPDGRFGYRELPVYWSEPGRHPFLAFIEANPVGFALVKEAPGILNGTAVWDMAEFFILRRFRRVGMGSELARMIWREFPGKWQVRVMDSNPAGRKFWETAISHFVGEPIRSKTVKVEGDSWHVFSFESPAVEPV